MGGFKFLDEDEIENFDLMSVAPGAEIGYIIECDLLYPPDLHDEHSDYPLAPKHLTVTKDMLSPYAKQLMHSWEQTKTDTKSHG